MTSKVIDVVNNMSAEEKKFKRANYIVGKYFCAKETISQSKVTVTVEGVGKVNFPIDKETINQLLNISTTAEFGNYHWNERHLRNPKMIPESKLKVELDEEVFTEVLSKIASQLKIDENCKLLPHLYNMLIYKNNFVFKEHRYIEKMNNMIATLVLVLPTFSKGGKLHVNHACTDIPFDWSSFLNVIHCIAFYSDCYYRITQVRGECRVVLTYNLELKGPDSPLPIDVTIVNDPLNDAVAQYFNVFKPTKYLILCLTHFYSEDSLMWYKLKGNDRIIASAMFAVSKKQKLTPYLALADSQEIWEGSYFGPRMTNKSIIMYHWLDENNVPCDRPEQFDVNEFYNEVCSDSFYRENKPYKENEIYNKREKWYRLTYIVLVKE